MNTHLLRKYAALVVRVGVNLQEDQPLVIHAPITCADFVHALAAEGYCAGAHDVAVNWSDEEFSHIRFRQAPAARFREFPAWRKTFYDESAAQGAAFISIAAENPDLFSDVDPKRLTEAGKTAGKALQGYRARLMSNQNTWCVVSVPTPAWACKVFPHETEETAVARLWTEILRAVRVSEESDPVAAWKEHVSVLQKTADFLNAHDFLELHYRNGLGTDLHVELPKGHIWMGGAERAASGTMFVANIPTEEVYTLPRCRRYAHEDAAQGRSSSPRKGSRLRTAGGRCSSFVCRLDRDLLDHNIMHGSVCITGLCVSNVTYDIHPLDHLSENGMMIIQPRRRSERDEELTSARIGARICHGEDTLIIVTE